MSTAVVLNENLEKAGEAEVPANFLEASPHNLYLYVKSYQAALRANTAHSKNRSAVSGGGKKPWSQKGRGGARAGSIRSPLFVGGGVAFGPKANRNYDQKVNNCYLIEENELNGYLAAAYRAVVIEKAVWENLTKEG